MESYAKYRLTSEREFDKYREKMGKQAFDAYLTRLYDYVISMKPGQKFLISSMVKEENVDLFVKLLCLFIWMHGTNTFIFSDDFNWFIRRKKI